MLNNFKFFEMISSDLDLKIFTDVFTLIREETKWKDIDICKITYDYSYLFNDFNFHQIMNSIMKLYTGLSFSIKNDKFGFGRIVSFVNFETSMDIENVAPHKVTIDIANIKYLEENFFIGKNR